MPVIIILAVVALIVILVVVVRKKNGEKDTSSKQKIEFPPIVPDEKKPASTIIYSDDYKGEKSISTKEGTHMIMTLLMFKEEPSVWVCSSCETENKGTSEQCEVCGFRK